MSTGNMCEFPYDIFVTQHYMIYMNKVIEGVYHSVPCDRFVNWSQHADLPEHNVCGRLVRTLLVAG